MFVVYKEFSYESNGKRTLKLGLFVEVINNHQVAYFFETQCISTMLNLFIM